MLSSPAVQLYITNAWLIGRIGLKIVLEHCRSERCVFYNGVTFILLQQDALDDSVLLPSTIGTVPSAPLREAMSVFYELVILYFSIGPFSPFMLTVLLVRLCWMDKSLRTTEPSLALQLCHTSTSTLSGSGIRTYISN